METGNHSKFKLVLFLGISEFLIKGPGKLKSFTRRVLHTRTNDNNLTLSF